MKSYPIIGTDITSISFSDSLEIITKKSANHEKGFVCFANSHMVVTARRNKKFAQDLTRALMILPDGMPIAKAFQFIYQVEQVRIAGMDFINHLFSAMNNEGLSVYLFGSTNTVLEKSVQKIKLNYPNIKISGFKSPPFGSDLTLADYTNEIAKTNPNVIIVSLGCPKQEQWMSNNFEKVNGIMLGLGGALPVFAGEIERGPKWMREGGLEWLYRLFKEPRRLYKRYLITNFLFIFYFLMQLSRKKE